MRLIAYIFTLIIALSNIDLIVTQDRVEYATEEVALEAIVSKQKELKTKFVFQSLKCQNVRHEKLNTISHLSTNLNFPLTSLYLKNRCLLL